MATEIFSKAQFEEALPTHRLSGDKLWEYVGFVKGEHQYRMPVKEGVEVVIRSSIDGTGYAAETGANSIRAWLWSSEHDRPLWKGDRSYVTRVPGWPTRLRKLLRKLYQRGLKVGRCNQCGGQAAVFKTKNGKNRGRLYYKCLACQKWLGWVPEKQPKLL